MLLAWGTIKLEGVDTNVARFMGRVLWELALHRSGATALRVVN